MPKDGIGIATNIGLGGSAAVCTVNFVHPIETIKTRLQIATQGAGVVGTTTSLVRNEGFSSLFKGISAAWGREALYSSVKLGGYAPIRDALGANRHDAPSSLKFLAGALSGSVGAFSGNPFDVMKIKMQAHTKGPHLQLRSLAEQLLQTQGLSGFYAGLKVNMLRAAVNNGTRMACYEKSKVLLKRYTGLERADPRSVLLSSIMSGFCMTCTVAPFDYVRTQLMNQPLDKKIYAGFVDCASQTFRSQGIYAFYRGFVPIWAQLAPATVLQLTIFETLLKFTGCNAI